MLKISLCMIVKNEEKVLKRCLQSAAPAVDEIIIVDTGSTDSTKRIAAEFTDKIYDFEWADDFSAARNDSFSKAGGDYILWLDADDVILAEDLEMLINLKKNLDSTADAVMMRYNTAFDEAGNPVFSFYRERLIKNGKGLTWQGRVHEAIPGLSNVIYSEAAVTHKSVKTEYSKRNLNIYEKQLKNGETFTPRDEFYYGRELYYHKYYDKAIHVLNHFLDENQGWLENNIEACKILSYCYSETDHILSALSSLMHSFIYASPRAEICCEIGSIFMKLQNYHCAVFWYKSALEIQPESFSGAFIQPDCYGYIPAIQLCVCYDKLKDFETAKLYNEIAGSFKPDSDAYKQNTEYFNKLLIT